MWVCMIFAKCHNPPNQDVFPVESFPSQSISELALHWELLWQSALVDVEGSLHEWISQILLSGGSTKAGTIKTCFKPFFSLLLWVALSCTRTGSSSGRQRGISAQARGALWGSGLCWWLSGALHCALELIHSCGISRDVCSSCRCRRSGCAGTG